MQIVWGGLFVVAAVAVLRGAYALKNGGARGIWNKANRPAVILAATIIAIAWGIFAAIQIGFIPNHAP